MNTFVNRINAKCLVLQNLIIFAIRKFLTKQTHTMMKKKITALLVGIFALVITAHAQVAPLVTFTATPAVICPGDTVTFTSSTTYYPTSWTWYIPGSSVPYYYDTVPSLPYENPPPVTYQYPGTYYVTCVVRNQAGADSVTVQNCVIVKPFPTAVILPPYGGICDTATPHDTISFHWMDTTRGNKYIWGPSNSLTCDSCKNPKAFPSVYTVYTVTVMGLDGCSIQVHDTVTTGNSITAKITGRDSICSGAKDTLIASGFPDSSKYTWSTGATTSSITVSPAVTTLYSVAIRSASASCVGTANFIVNAFPIPHFTITSPDSICVPGSADITLLPHQNAPYQYFWYGPPYGRLDTDNFVVSPTTNTSYTLVVRNIGCYFDTVVKIKANYPPHPYFTGPTDLCQGSEATITAYGGQWYRWSTGQTTSSINIVGVVSKTWQVIVGAGECSVDTSFTVKVDTNPVTVFKGDTSICVGQSTTIYAVPPPGPGHSSYGYTYLWNQGSSGDSVFTGPLTSSQTYSLVVSKGACSKDSGTITVKVYPMPKPKLWPNDTIVCEYHHVPLTATGGDYYIWTPNPDSLQHYLGYGDTDVNSADPSVPTKYTVKTCTWGCCTGDTGLPAVPASASAFVNVLQGVQDYSVCCNTTVTSGTPVQLSATYSPSNNPSYYIEGWSPDAGLSCNNCADPTATVYNTTTYVVTFMDAVDGCPVSDSVTIDIFNCNVFVPNVFSPNGDGVNDLLYVRSLCLNNMDFVIFDRWGNQVFETHDINTPWDGRYKGKDMETGTYMWFLTGLMEDGTHISKNGNVTLVR